MTGDIECKSVFSFWPFSWTFFLTLFLLVIEFVFLIFPRFSFSLCNDKSCLEEFYLFMKVPAATFYIGSALCGIFAVWFKTKQAARQISEAIKQNKFRNYLDHYSSFRDLCVWIEGQHPGGADWIDSDTLYKKIFPVNTYCDVDPVSRKINSSPSFIKSCLIEYNDFKESINRFFSKFSESFIGLPSNAVQGGDVKSVPGFANGDRKYFINFEFSSFIVKNMKRDDVEEYLDVLDKFYIVRSKVVKGFSQVIEEDDLSELAFSKGDKFAQYPLDIELALGEFESVIGVLNGFCIPEDVKVIDFVESEWRGKSLNLNTLHECILRN